MSNLERSLPGPAGPSFHSVILWALRQKPRSMVSQHSLAHLISILLRTGHKCSKILRDLLEAFFN